MGLVEVCAFLSEADGLAMSGVALGGFLYLTGAALHPQFPLCMVFVGMFAAFMDKILHSELPLSLGPLDCIFMSARMHQILSGYAFRRRLVVRNGL